MHLLLRSRGDSVHIVFIGNISSQRLWPLPLAPSWHSEQSYWDSVFSVVFTVRQEKGLLIRFLSGRYLAGHFVAFRHALGNRLCHLSFDLSSGSTLTLWRAIERANSIWHGERIHFWHFGNIHNFAPICFQAGFPTFLVFGSGGSRRNFRLVLE